MEKTLKRQQQIRFSGDGASNQNGKPECTIKMVVTMARNMLTHDELICPKDTLSTGFGQ